MSPRSSTETRTEAGAEPGIEPGGATAPAPDGTMPQQVEPGGAADTEAQPAVGPAVEPAVANGPRPVTTSSAGITVTDTAFGVVAAFGFWIFVAAVVVWSNDTSRAFVQEHWVLSSVALGSTVIVLGFFAGQKRIRQSHQAVRAGLVLAFGVIPAGALALLPETAQLYTLRGLFLLVVIFTPTVMWWLFVVGQRESLLNEFLANLDRLGVLDPDAPAYRQESDQAHRTRISSYLQKFESNFVRVSPAVYDAVTRGKVPPAMREDSGNRTPLATSAVPVLLTLLLMTIGWLLTLPLPRAVPDVNEPAWEAVLTPTLTPVTVAFLGAYFFSLQMLFRRYVRRDLRGSAYIAVTMRIVLALVGTWVVTAIAVDAGAGAADWQLLTTGFVIGVFPKVAWQIVRGLFAKFSRPALPAIEAALPLSELDGLTVWHEARMEEEDIENVPNMANADLVELMVSTRFPPDRLIDWTDQAILLTHLGPEQARSRRSGRGGRQEADTTTSRAILAAHGIRSASDLLSARAVADREGRRDQFDRMLGDDGALQDVVAAMGTSSNLRRVTTWRAEVVSAQPVLSAVEQP